MEKTTLITGASSGIGLELARVFARNRHDLVLVARSRERLEQLAGELREQHGVDARVIVKDLSVPASPQEIFDELQRDGVQVEVLVNNAGIQEYGPFLETDLQKELQLIQVNLTSLTHLTKLFLPGMVERGHGRIMNLGSTGSFVPGPLNAVYCATKAYVLSFSEAIAEELVGTGVDVTALCPGATATEFAQRAGIEDVRLFRDDTMNAVDVAEIGYRALMKGRRVVVTGLQNQLMVFSIRFAPRSMVAAISKRLMSRP